MTPRQQRIKEKLYDDLQDWRFTKVSDPLADAKLDDLIEKLDKAYEAELVAMKLLVRDKNTGRIGRYGAVK
jgi:hypothetical protein